MPMDALSELQSVPVLCGARVILRPWQESDRVDRLAIGRHAEYVRLCGGDPGEILPFTEAELTQWYVSRIGQPCNWAIAYEGRCIGEARLHSLHVQDHWAYYAIGLWDPTTWGRGLGREATRLVLVHAFRSLGLHRIALRVLAINQRAIACYTACGFRREGLERESCHVAGQWLDDVMMGVLAHEFEHLGLDSGPLDR